MHLIIWLSIDIKPHFTSVLWSINVCIKYQCMYPVSKWCTEKLVTFHTVIYREGFNVSSALTAWVIWVCQPCILSVSCPPLPTPHSPPLPSIAHFWTFVKVVWPAVALGLRIWCYWRFYLKPRIRISITLRLVIFFCSINVNSYAPQCGQNIYCITFQHALKFLFITMPNTCNYDLIPNKQDHKCVFNFFVPFSL